VFETLRERRQEGDWHDPVLSAPPLALCGLIFGVVGGALFGTLLPALSGGSAVLRLAPLDGPGRYEVVVDEVVTDEAVGLIGGLRTTGGGSSPYLNEHDPESRRRRRTGRSSSWRRQWASTWAPPTR
jgi:hypothetical protein